MVANDFILVAGSDIASLWGHHIFFIRWGIEIDLISAVRSNKTCFLCDGLKATWF